MPYTTPLVQGITTLSICLYHLKGGEIDRLIVYITDHL